MPGILVIQTAFIGDVVLITPLIRKVKETFRDSEIDVLVRKGNEPLLENNPLIRKVLVWDKRKNKYANLFKIIRQVRTASYERIYNVHRYWSSGLITAFSGATFISGFQVNPLSFVYHRKAEHSIPQFREGKAIHEVERNLLLLGENLPHVTPRPELYPSDEDLTFVSAISGSQPYFVMAPCSVWYTKQMPGEKWVELARLIPSQYKIFFIGGPADKMTCAQITKAIPNAINLCGAMSLLQSAALMKKAIRVFTNDSAPLHIASSVNAPVTAIFCSTLPEYGFGPLSENSKISRWEGECCSKGIHGLSKCPSGHFNCGNLISLKSIYNENELAQDEKNIMSRN